jgi:hypothetical protein
MEDSEVVSLENSKYNRKLYEILHEKLKVENDLTNQRLTWNFAIQALLFAAWMTCAQTVATLKGGLADPIPPLQVFSLEKILEIPDKLRRFHEIERYVQSLSHAEWVIAAIGILMNLVILCGTVGAQLAAWQIACFWLKKNKNHNVNLPWWPEYDRTKPWSWTSCGKYLPGLFGGGNAIAYHLGLVPPFGIPLIFVGAWITLLILNR